MAKTANPTKKFRYSIELNGFQDALCQKVMLGEIEIAKDEHGDGNKNIKTPGKVTIPDIGIEKLTAANTSDPYFVEWMRSCQNSTTGNSELPSSVKRDFIVNHLNPNGSIRRQWLIVGAWPTKETLDDLGDLEEGNYLETYTLSVDDIIPQIV